MASRTLPPLVAPPRARRRLRRGRAGALAAVVAYGAALFAGYHLVTDVREPQAPAVEAAVRPAATLGASPTAAGGELLALRALASRAQRSVYVVESSAAGSGFVAWVEERRQRSYLITARTVVAGLLADGGRTLYVRSGERVWPAKLVRADPRSGLALVRVETLLERPLWQVRIDGDPLEAGAAAVVVPAGPDAPFGEGRVAAAGDRFRLAAGTEPLYLGAPVVSENGRLAGVVVGAGSDGASRVVPIGAACGKIRPCT